MLSYEEMRNAHVDENRRMLQDLGVIIPSAAVRPVFNRAKISTKRSRHSKLSEPPTESELDEIRNDNTGGRVSRSSFRVRLKAKNYNSEENEVWEAPQRRVPRVRPENSYGSIEGVEVGREWTTRMDCSYDLIHRPTVAGIHGGKDGAYSVALSGGYEDDIDLGDSFTYTGEGGRDLKGTPSDPKNLRTAAQSKDQTLDRGNLALSVSVETQNPVRVIRGYKLVSPYAPEEGYRYDGLYLVKKFWVARGKSGFKVFKFAFVRCDPEPAPWATLSPEKNLKLKSPTSPSTPTCVPKDNLEACEAPSLEGSASGGTTHLEEASKGATEPEERLGPKKRVSFHMEDSVRVFEREDADEESENEVNNRVLTRRSSKLLSPDPETTVASSRELHQNSRKKSPKVLDENLPEAADDSRTLEASETTPKPLSRTRELKRSPRCVKTPKTDASPKRTSPKQSDEDEDTISKVSKPQKRALSPVEPAQLRSKRRSLTSPPDSSPEEPTNMTHDHENPPFSVRKSQRSLKPTEKIKSPGDFRWLKKSPKREEASISPEDVQKSKNALEVSQERKVLSARNKEEKLPSDSPKLRQPLKVKAEKRPADDSPNRRKSPKLSEAQKSPNDSPKPKKSPNLKAEKKASAGSPELKTSSKLSAKKTSLDVATKPTKSPKLAEKKAAGGTPQLKKSPKFKVEDRTPDGTTKSNKSPKLSGAGKSPKLGAERKTSDGTPKLSKSPKISGTKKSSAEKLMPKLSPKPKKTPEAKPKAEKVTKLGGGKKSSLVSPKSKKPPEKSPAKVESKATLSIKKGKPPTNGKYAKKSLPQPVLPPAKSQMDSSKPKKSPKASKLEKNPQKVLKSPYKASSKSPNTGKKAPSEELSESPKKATKKLPAGTRKLVTKQTKSASVEAAASILSKAKSSKPTSTFQKKLAMIASARARALKLKETPMTNLKQASINGNVDSVPLPESKLKNKSSQKTEKTVPQKSIQKASKRSASPAIQISPSRQPVRKKSRAGSPMKQTLASEKRQDVETVMNDLDSSQETPSPPILHRYDEEETRLRIAESPQKKTLVPDRPAAKEVAGENSEMEALSPAPCTPSHSSPPTSPPWTPLSSSPSGKAVDKTPSSAEKPSQVARKLMDESFDDDEMLGMMQFSLCSCSGDGNTKVTIKMVGGKWTEIIEPIENSCTGKENNGFESNANVIDRSETTR